MAAAAEARRPKPEEPPITLRTVLAYFGAVVVLAAVAAVRGFRRRARAG